MYKSKYIDKQILKKLKKIEKRFILILLAFIIFFSSCAQIDVEPKRKIDRDYKYAVVSNKKMPDLSLLQLRAIFLKKTTLINKLQVIPINLSPNDELRLKFEKQVLEMDFKILKSYWIKQYELGIRPPITMKSEESLITFLKKVDGSIGYVRAKNIDDSLKILYKWSD